MEEAKTPDTRTTEATTTADAPLYKLSFLQKEFAPIRRQLLGTLLVPLIYTSLLMWGCLSLYYGSLTSSNKLSKVTVYAVDLDGGLLGQQIIAGVKKSQASSSRGPDWNFDAGIDSTEMSRELVLDERAWAVLQISPNASANLDTALANQQSPSAAYNPLNSVTLFYASARNQITVLSQVVPVILSTANPLITQAGIAHTAQFLALNAENSTLLSQVAKDCPQCLASPFAISQVDLIPFSKASPVTTGTTMVGLIFLLTFAFSVFNILRQSGMTVAGAQLRIRDTLILRTAMALAAYLALALWSALINLAFGVPMNYGREGRGGGRGFVVFWMLSWFTMAAVGLPMESLFTLIGIQWSGYFLTFWIIVNVSGAFTSSVLMPGFYLYGRGFPFYHSIQGLRTIIFGTKSHLGVNFGVLLAWMFLGWLGVMIFTVRLMRKNKRINTHRVK